MRLFFLALLFPCALHAGSGSAQLQLFTKELEKIGLGADQIKDVVKRSPFLDLWTANVLSTHEWLVGQGVPSPEALIQSYPQVFSLSLERLNATVEWLKATGVEDPATVLSRAPPVLGFRLDNLQSKVTWLREQGFKSPQNMIEKFPSLLCFSLEENLKPTLQTLRVDWKLGIRTIEADPMVLGASLERLQALHLNLSHLGLEPDHLTKTQRRIAIKNLTVSDLFENLRDLGFLGRAKSILEAQPHELPPPTVLTRELPKWFKKVKAHDSLAQSREEKAAWLKAHGVEDPYGVLDKNKELLTLSLETNLNPKIEWLKQLGVQDFGAFLEAHSHLLYYSLERNLVPKIAWLEQQGVRQLGAVIETYPRVLSLRIKENLEPKVAWLKAQGVRDPGALIEHFPRLLGYNIKANLAPKIQWLRSHGVQDVGLVLERCPSFLGFNLDSLDLKIAWLHHNGIKNTGAMIERYPQLLSLNLDGSLKSKLHWFKLQGIQDPVSLIERYPSILGFNLETMSSKVAFLRSHGIQDTAALLTKYPSVLGFSVEHNLEPTITALKSEWGFEVLTIESHPILLGSSLSRSKSLLAAFHHLGVNVKTHLPYAQKMLAVKSLKPSDLLTNLKTLGLVDVSRTSLLEIAQEDLPCQQTLLATLPAWVREPAKCSQLWVPAPQKDYVTK